MTDDDPQAWHFRAIVDGAPEAIVAANPEGVIQLWNPGAEAMFGYRADEAVGQKLDLIVPESFRERHWTGYYGVMQTGTSRYGSQMLSVPAVRKDGTRISIEFHVVVLHDPAGALAGMAAIVRDVTERWERDRALRKRVQELEAGQAER